jgi:hypothetical protein
MILVLERCTVRKARTTQGKKGDTRYWCNVDLPDGELVLTSTEIDLTALPMITPLSLTLDLRPELWGNNQMLVVTSASAKQL